MTGRARGPLDSAFEAGHVPCDEPPGFEEAEYRRWKAGGGQVLAPEPAPPTWAIVELMGHLKLAGLLSEEEKFGAKMGRVDVPSPVPCPRCGGSGGGPDPANSCGLCVRGQVSGFLTVYFGGASVYRIQVVSEEVARHVSRDSPQPVSPWDFPKPALPAAGRKSCADCIALCADYIALAEPDCDAGRCAAHCDQRCNNDCKRSERESALLEDDDGDGDSE